MTDTAVAGLPAMGSTQKKRTKREQWLEFQVVLFQ
jgi:hypothetical protein